jgi:hypothetical protein
LNPNGASVFRNGRTYGFFPSTQCFYFFESLAKARVTASDLFENIKKIKQAHHDSLDTGPTLAVKYKTKMTSLDRKFIFACFASVSLLQGCGYGFRGTHNPLISKYGVQRIFVSPLRNDSYKPGVENLVYNELVRGLVAGGRVRVVSNSNDADALLEGVISDAQYTRGAVAPADQLKPINDDRFKWVPKTSKGVLIATTYTAQLSVGFKLISKESNEEIWASGFSRSKEFEANNQVGVLGNTSSIINESEFDRALADMARNMMADVHESMLDLF